jgi:hypothetical protein
MNSVDIAALFAKDDAEYLGDVAAIALIAGVKDLWLSEAGDMSRP